ncbi:hypothetical protein Tco_0926153 [Tanacetum coccineum]|uniref:Uncharacterized protein n=1 Tax=Tanacetum coccineum TaxID=301880 RepID=A0ABQ5D9Y0_9ASTR
MEQASGPAFNLLKGTCSSSIKLEYNFQECFNALTDRLDWNTPEGDRYPFDLSKPLPLQGPLGHRIIVVDYFFNNDLEYQKTSDPEVTYTTSITKTKTARIQTHYRYAKWDVAGKIPTSSCPTVQSFVLSLRLICVSPSIVLQHRCELDAWLTDVANLESKIDKISFMDFYLLTNDQTSLDYFQAFYCDAIMGQMLYQFQINQRDYFSNDTFRGQFSDICALYYEGIVPTEMEQVLEYTQLGASHEVLVTKMPKATTTDISLTKSYIPKVSKIPGISPTIAQFYKPIENRNIHEGRVVDQAYYKSNNIERLFTNIRFNCLFQINEPIVPRFILDFYSQVTYSQETEGPYCTDLPTPDDIRRLLELERVVEEFIRENVFRLGGHRDRLPACLAHMLYCVVAEEQYNLAYFFVKRIECARATPTANLPAPNAPSKTPSTKDTSSSSIDYIPKSPTSSISPNGYLNPPTFPPPRVSPPPPTQENASMDITITLSSITPLDVQFDTPSPSPPIFGHHILWNLLEAHGDLCLCCIHNRTLIFGLRDELQYMFLYIEHMLSQPPTTIIPPPLPSSPN